MLISFQNTDLTIIYYLSLFKITKNGLKKICAFFYLKIKLLMQSKNLMLLKLFFLISLLFFFLIQLIFNKIEIL